MAKSRSHDGWSEEKKAEWKKHRREKQRRWEVFTSLRLEICQSTSDIEKKNKITPKRAQELARSLSPQSDSGSSWRGMSPSTPTSHSSSVALVSSSSSAKASNPTSRASSISYAHASTQTMAFTSYVNASTSTAISSKLRMKAEP